MSLLLKRQNGGGYDDGFDDSDDPYFYDNWAIARFVIAVVIVAFVFIYFVGGYWHARRRLRAGLPPLRYHAFMVRRRYMNPYNNNGMPWRYPQPGEAYPLNEQSQGFPAPPPPYQPPPTYQPPVGASKVLADQNVSTYRTAEGDDGAPSASGSVSLAAGERHVASPPAAAGTH